MSDPNALPIAGWYPDPENEAGDRWWNGVTWSDHRRPRNAPASWAPAPVATATATAAAADATAPPIPVPPVADPPFRPNPYAVANPYSGQAGAPSQPAPGYAPYAPNYARATPMRNPAALAGMVTSLVAILFNWILFGAPGLAGAIISFIGLRKANVLKRDGVTVGNGTSMAIIGIVAGLVGAFLWDLFYFAVFAPFNY